MKCLVYIRENKNHASTDSIKEFFNTSKEEVNEFIDYLHGKKFIKEPIQMIGGKRIKLELESKGLDLITRLK